MRLFRFNKRIGVIGMYRSGKTVFLTSLINHLQNHARSRFPIGDGRVEFGNFKKLTPDKRLHEFEYERYRQDLVSRRHWPEKSKVTSHYKFNLTRSDWPRTRMTISMMDLPGERLADFSIALYDFSGWSRYVINSIKNQSEYKKHAESYIRVLETSSDETEIINAYKQTLGRFFKAYMPIITPSTFLLDTGGGYVGQGSVDDLARERFSGLDSGSQFAPLSDNFFEGKSELAALFESRYRKYKKKLVVPFSRHLASCHQLVILVDITTILAGGLGMYHSNLDLLETLTEYLEPGRGPLGQLFSALSKLLVGPLKVSPPGITRIAFVATKVDKVHADQRQRLLGLLKSMVGKRMRDLQADKQLSVEYFTVASVNSTASLPGGMLEGRPMEISGGAYQPADSAKIKKFTPSELPVDWPENWQPGQYLYPNVWPQMPARKDLPPPHIELNRIAEFLFAPDNWNE